MLEPSFHRDGVEALLDRINTPHNPHLILPADFLLHHGRAWKDAVPIMPEGFQRRTVFKLSDYGGMERLLAQPIVQQTAKHGVGGRQQQGGAFQ